MPDTRSTGERRHRRRWPLSGLLLLLFVVVAAACAGPFSQPTATPPPTPTAAPTATATAVARQAGTPTATATATRPAPTATRPTLTPTRFGAPTPTAFVLRQPAKPWERLGLEGQALNVVAVTGGDPPTLFAGGEGLWRSSDGGRTWHVVREPDQAPRVVAIATAGADPRSQTVYVGVNQGCARGMRSRALVSGDGGFNWRELPETVTDVTDFAVDPGSARTVYAVGCAGSFRSADAGATWEELRGARLDNYDPALIAIAPSESQTLYIAYVSEGGTVRVRRSTDGGTTWQDAHPPGDPVGPLALAVDSRDPAVVLLSTTTGLYKTTNGGRAWALVAWLESTATPVPGRPAATPVPARPAASPTPGGRPGASPAVSPVPTVLPAARIAGALLADPEEQGRFWLGTGQGPIAGSGVYRTNDAGVTWSRTAGGLEQLAVSHLALSGPRNARVVYAATGDGLWVLPANPE